MTGAITASRTSFEDWLRDVGIDEEPRDELAVVFSELVSNATRAAATTGEVPRVDAWREPDSVVLQVSNPVRGGKTPVEHPQLDDPLRTGGRGLVIVRAYTDDVTITATDDAVTVRCRRLLN